MTSTSPSSFDPANLSYSMPTKPYNVEATSQLGTPGSTVLPSSNLTVAYPTSAESSDNQYPHPTKSFGDTNALYQTSPSKAQGIGKATRKRPRSSQPTEEQISTIQRNLSKRTGIPEGSLGAFCFSQALVNKRPRTNSQTQNKKQVENAGGSCLLCFLDKKQVISPPWSEPVSSYSILISLAVLWSASLSVLQRILAETCR